MTPELLAQVATEVQRLGVDAARLSELRAAFPGLHFSHCQDDDVICAKPVFQGEGFNLYLVDGNGHCLRLTTELTAATGILVADRDTEL